MKLRTDRILSSLICLLLLATGLVSGFVAGFDVDVHETDLPEQTMADSGVIWVNNEAELANVASIGSGTIADPYIIENQRIEAMNSCFGILIGNTTSHLIIKECEVSGAERDWSSAFATGDAIKLYRTKNILVEDCDLHDCTYGLSTHESDNITVRGNIVHSIEITGITSYSSHDVLAERNSLGSVGYGLSSSGSHNISFRNNSVSWSSEGISSYFSRDVEIEDNICSNTTNSAIVLYTTNSFCRITNNTCKDSVGAGIDVHSANDILIVNNTLLRNGDCGIRIDHVQRPIVEGNRIDGYGGSDGVFLERSDYGRIRGNRLTNVSGNGITLLSSAHNHIANNSLSDIIQHFYLAHSEGGLGNDYNLISNNTCYHGSVGIYIHNCDALFNNITNNVFTGFNITTISVVMGSYNLFNHNQVIFNTFSDSTSLAISINSSTADGNRIYGNAIINCTKDGQICHDLGSSLWNSTRHGNYWHNHNLPDLDHDNIVDTPLSIDPGSNTDYLPLSSPLWITEPLSDGMVVELNEIVLQGVLINHWDVVSFNWSNVGAVESGNLTPGLEWTCSIDLRGGENEIIVTMVDVAGRHFTDSITIINTKTILVMHPVDGATVYTRNGTIDLALNVTGYWPLVKATVEHSVNCELVTSWIDNSMAGQTNFEGVWTLDIEEGENYFLFWFDNSMGGWITGVLFVIRDNLAPTIEFVFPSEGACVSVPGFEVEWSVSDATEIVSQTYTLDFGAPVNVTGSSIVLSDLEEGHHSFQLNVTDSCGNKASRKVNFTVDQTEPFLLITSPADGTLFDGNDVLVTFSTDDALTAVEYVQYRLDQGDWTMIFVDYISLADLPDGEHTVEIESYDQVLNRNTTSVSFTIDTTAPVVTITSPNEGGYSSTRTVTWTVDDVSGAELIEVSTDNATWTTITGSSRTFMMADGTHTVHVRVTDRVGLVGTDNVTFTIDTLTPTLDIVSPSGSAYNNTGSVLVRWNAADANGITKTEVSKDGSSWSVVTGTSTTLTGLTDGTWTIYVRVMDPAGNVMTDSATVGVSLSGPSVDLLPDETLITRDDNVDVTADISGAVPLSSVVLRVHVEGEMMSEVDLTADVLGDRTALITSIVELSEGVNVISLTVNDSAGNSVVVEVTVVLDTTAPTLVIDLPTDGSLLNVTEGIVQWTASDEGSGLNNTWARMDDGDWIVLGAAEGWRYISLTDGEHTLFVRADDQAGNSVERNVTFVVDTVAPTAEVSPIGDELELDSVVVIEFSEQMNITSVIVTMEGVVGNVSWEGNLLTLSPSALEYARDYLVTVSGRDLAGNAMELNWTFTTTAGTGSLTGTLVNEDGEPLANVTVHAGDQSAVTNDLGRFVLNDLAPANYILTVNKEGYEMYSSTVSVVAGDSDELGELTLIAQEAEEDDSGDNTLLIVIAGVVVIAVIGAAAVIFLRRKT